MERKSRMKREGPGRVGWVVSQLEIGRRYESKDILDLFKQDGCPYDPIDRVTAKNIIYGIQRTKRYMTETKKPGRRYLVLLKRAAEKPEQNIVFEAFDRACRGLFGYFCARQYPNVE